MAEDIKLPPAPKPEEFISKEAAAAYIANTIDLAGGGKCNHEYLVDRHANNAFKYLALIKNDILAGASQSKELSAQNLLLLKPELRSYTTIDRGIAVGSNISSFHSRIRSFLDDDSHGAPLILKSSAYALLNEAYSLFDDAPENERAAESRKVLQDAAKVLGLPELGKSKWADRGNSVPERLSVCP